MNRRHCDVYVKETGSICDNPAVCQKGQYFYCEKHHPYAEYDQLQKEEARFNEWFEKEGAYAVRLLPVSGIKPEDARDFARQVWFGTLERPQC